MALACLLNITDCCAWSPRLLPACQRECWTRMASTCLLISSWGDASFFSQASSSATIHRLLYIRNKERAAAYITETSLPDAAWLLGRRLLKVSPGTTRSEEQPADKETSQENIPTWSGYNSLVSQILPPSQGCHGTTACCSSTKPTLLTILVQTHGINDIVVGL